MSQLPKRLTPLQEVLKECNRLASNVAETREELHRLRDMQEKIISLLPSEQQLLSETFERGWCDRGYDRRTMNEYKSDFLSQFNQDK